MLSEETIKQIFFLSDKPCKNALIADEVDVMQFAQNVAAYVAVRVRAEEHARCVDIARSHNSAVADLLDRLKP